MSCTPAGVEPNRAVSAVIVPQAGAADRLGWAVATAACAGVLAAHVMAPAERAMALAAIAIRVRQDRRRPGASAELEREFLTVLLFLPTTT